MSTRATYQFTGARSRGLNHSVPTITVYIHHDGYPEGAAFYFWNAHHATRGALAVERFLFANDRAEITESHEAHGDTEYRYTVTREENGDHVTAYAGKWPGGDGPRVWSVFYVGPVVEFINKYGPGGVVEDFTPLRTIAPVYDYSGARASIYSRGQILEGLAKSRAELESYRERFPQYTGNIAGHESTVRTWERALDSYDAQDQAPAKVAR